MTEFRLWTPSQGFSLSPSSRKPPSSFSTILSTYILCSAEAQELCWVGWRCSGIDVCLKWGCVKLLWTKSLLKHCWPEHSIKFRPGQLRPKRDKNFLDSAEFFLFKYCWAVAFRVWVFAKGEGALLQEKPKEGERWTAERRQLGLCLWICPAIISLHFYVWQEIFTFCLA